MNETAARPEATVTEPAPRRRIKEMEVMVAEAKVETPDTVTLVLFTGNDRLDYRAGHFLTIDPHQFEALDRFVAYFEDAKGKKEPARAYSMSSAPHERYLAITVKEERYVSGQTKYPPLLSPLLVKRTTRGMRLVVTGFTGPYVLPDDVESRTDHLVHVVAGSGAVPNFAILKDALVRYPSLRHTFVCSNKGFQDVIFRDELALLEQKHPSRLRVVHTLTRDPVTPVSQGVWKGRISAATLRDLIPDPRAALVYACGPAVGPLERAAARASGEEPKPRFLESVLQALREVGVPDAHVTRESYG
ncbi:MAG TPA: oxidoreductase [Anaeromyxobacteraceae bacterium]|nr:oxidoreductase [Anaeromyxobacteraceae bacterium]